MKKLAILFLVLATPAQANLLTLICTGKTYSQDGGAIEMVPVTAVLDLDKLTSTYVRQSIARSLKDDGFDLEETQAA